MNRKFGKKGVAVGFLAVAMTLGLQLPARASTDGSMNVNCDTLWKDYSQAFNHSNKSTPMYLKNNSTSPWSIVYFAWRSATSGNTLVAKGPVAPGYSTSAWTNVATGWYYPMVRRDAVKNCNGSLPGNGTFAISFTATY